MVRIFFTPETIETENEEKAVLNVGAKLALQLIRGEISVCFRVTWLNFRMSSWHSGGFPYVIVSQATAKEQESSSEGMWRSPAEPAAADGSYAGLHAVKRPTTRTHDKRAKKHARAKSTKRPRDSGLLYCPSAVLL